MTAIHQHGYWLDGADLPHRHDEGLEPALVEFCRGLSVVDFGCGLGTYVAAMRLAGIDARGYDGNPHTAELTGGSCGVLDLTERHWLGRAFDVVVCLEVLEHIPGAMESLALDNLDRHCGRWLVLSWAAPDQGGHGHVNERPADYVAEAMLGRGFEREKKHRDRLRAAAFRGWHRRNLTVWRRLP
jgi:SAM-dependent methyltransferase